VSCVLETDDGMSSVGRLCTCRCRFVSIVRIGRYMGEMHVCHADEVLL
jgi:hypothetical protein